MSRWQIAELISDAHFLEIPALRQFGESRSRWGLANLKLANKYTSRYTYGEPFVSKWRYKIPCMCLCPKQEGYNYFIKSILSTLSCRIVLDACCKRVPTHFTWSSECWGWAFPSCSVRGISFSLLSSVFLKSHYIIIIISICDLLTFCFCGCLHLVGNRQTGVN